MKVLLINPPNNYFDAFELAPPLGLLSLAASVRCEDVDVEVLDFNLRGIADHSFVDHGFYEKALSLIEQRSPDVIGLTSMVVNSHVALELGRRAKAVDPAVRVVLGGTHFSPIAEEVLVRYPWVDYVVEGEGELPFRDLVRLLKYGSEPSVVRPLSGVAFRDGDRVVSSHVMKPFASMDALPMPAYDLVDLNEYFRVNPDRVLDYEPGRGCMYKCAFCYSPIHYGSGGQSKTIDRILGDMQRLQDLGARHLFFVQDNFVNNSKLAKEICIAIASAGFELTWNCYTTLPQMTEEMMRLLGAARCTNAFTGVDAVNEQCQREFLKKFYKGWEPFERTIRYSIDSGVVPTCAFLVENPSAGIENVDRTLVTALFARCNGAELRLNTLTLYNGTPSEAARRDACLTYSELKPRLLLDCPGLIEINDYARTDPRLFPFHSTYLAPDLWHRFAVGMHITYTLVHSFPLTLYRWVTEDAGSIWRMVDELTAEIPDLLEVHSDERRGVERVLFERWFERQPRMQRLTCETFELELAHQSIQSWRGPTQLTVRTPDKEAPREIVVLPHQVTRLGYDVAGLCRFDLAAPPRRLQSRPVLLKGGGESLEYFELRPDVADALAALRIGETAIATVPTSALEALQCMGLVSEAAEAGETCDEP
jgi:hypothetical protein